MEGKLAKASDSDSKGLPDIDKGESSPIQF